MNAHTPIPDLSDPWSKSGGIPFAKHQPRPIGDLQSAVVYDIETPEPTVFTFNVVGLFDDTLDMTFEISRWRDDRAALLSWFNYWAEQQTLMVGFNNVGFDYPVVHHLHLNPYATAGDLYDVAQSIIGSFNRFAHLVWPSERFAPQIDLFKIHHMDNRAKSTSLKALQVAMRSPVVLEMPIAFGTELTREQIDNVLIPYNKHDVLETKRFAHYSMDAIKFRLDLMATLHGDVLNMNDTKIGAKILEQRLGDDLCYERDPDTNRRTPRRTVRERIPLADIIFPYVRFITPEFNRVLAYLRDKVLLPDEFSGRLTTKGVLTGLTATVGGLEFHFGTGGIHGSVESQCVQTDSEYGIFDVDVAGMYPAIAIVNKLAPAHLGEAFTREYAKLPQERKEWQAKKGKKCVEANSMKLAGNGTYGNTNNEFSPFFDSAYTMTVTVNGQLMLCMLAEWLLTMVPTLTVLQVNTDGVTYRCRRDYAPHAEHIQRQWERYTCLQLEQVEYRRMWIRDVNSYVAENTKDELKIKGAFWWPVQFPDDISNSQPPAWHKDLSAVVVQRAAVEHMTKGADIEAFVKAQRDPFEFMCRAKVDRSSKLYIGDREVQRITRYYIAVNGGEMRKVMPAKGPVGTWKRKNGISDMLYHTVLGEVGDAWDARIHTGNKSKYDERTMSIESGFKVAECNRASDFDFGNVNFEWYVQQARKLVIS